MQIALSNSGTITTAQQGQAAASLGIDDYQSAGGAIRFDNSGTIDASGAGGVGAQIGFYAPAATTNPARTIAITNSGTIRGNGGGLVSSGVYYPGGMQPVEYTATSPAGGVHVFGNGDVAATITNTASGVICLLYTSDAADE